MASAKKSSKVVALHVAPEPIRNPEKAIGSGSIHLERAELLQKFRERSRELAAVKDLFNAMLQGMTPAQRREQMTLMLATAAKSADEVQRVALTLLIENFPKLELSRKATQIAGLITQSTAFPDVRELFQHITSM